MRCLGLFILFLFMTTITLHGQAPIRVLSSAPALLGEGAWWDACQQRFAWIDIEGKRLVVSAADARFEKSYALKKRPGTVVPTNKGNYLLALEDSIVLFTIKTEQLKRVAHILVNTQEVRFNDGKCDAAGNLWVGTMDCKDYNKPVGKLYRISETGIIDVKLTGITISNGLTWSLDNKTFYYIDSPTRTVKAYDFDLASGEISNGRVVITTPDSLGTPDGCTIDSKGNLWVAQWGGSCVTYWDPRTGALLDKLAIPAFNVTSVALGGADLDELHVTTASIGMDEKQKQQFPDAGHVFVYKVKTPGVPANYWKED